MQNLTAIIAVNRDPTPPGNVTDNGITRYRLATPGDGGQQVTHALDGEVSRCLVLTLPLSIGRFRDQIFGLWFGLLGPQPIA